MASMLADADEIRTIQSQISDLAIADLGDLFDLTKGLDPEGARNLLLDSLPPIVATYGDLSATAAGEWFETLREREVGSGFQARLADSVSAEPVQQSVRFAAQHLFDDQATQMQAYLVGQLVKWVSQPSRMTIIASIDADPAGYGWQRVVRPGGCKFCRMLADRGGVYTRKSVWFASHANCNCGAVPSWDDSLPEVTVDAYKASVRMDSVRSRANGTADDDAIARARANAGGKLKDEVTDAQRVADQRQAQRILRDHRARTKAWMDTLD